MDMSKKTCPYCGSRLNIVPPSHEYFPNSTGVTFFGVEFSMRPARRIWSYTRKPCAEDSSYITEYKRIYESSYGGFSNRAQVYRRVDENIYGASTDFMRKQIEKGGFRLYYKNYYFMCDKCHNKLAINENPWRVFVIMVFIAFLTPLFLMNFWFGEVIPLWLFVIPGAVCVIGFVIYCLIGLFMTIHIEKYRSNFAPVDEHDSLMVPSTDIVMTPEGTDRRFLHESNVFQTELCGDKFSVYLIKKRETLSFSICGVDGEPQRILSLLQEKMSAGETVTLTLSFEGKPAGSARVLEISERRKRDES